MKFGALLSLLLLDGLTKKWAAFCLAPLQYGKYPFGGIGVFSDFFGISFSLNQVGNTGAAWGLFPEHPTLLFLLRIAIIAVLVGYLIFKRSNHSFPLWLIATGAIGNVLDYVIYRHVIDFFHFNFWGYSFPVFNFADSYITIGVLLLCLPFKKRIQPA
ncbi:MAG: signal peptidase II [Chlamydiae bacterium]|nr:signal peptidase II [Chlamydiota bacterium]